MDFDHVSDKRALISELVKASNMSALRVEVKNCEIVCANCHHIRTYERILIAGPGSSAD